MKFIVWLLAGAVCVLAQEPVELNNEINGGDSERGARFLNFRKLYTIDTNEVISEKKEDPNSALDGLYTDCVMSFSLPCLQKKFLVFLDKLGRMEGFSIIGDFLAVRRTTKETTKPISEKAIEARMNSEGDLDSLVEYAIDRFFSTHKLQVKLPFGLSVIGGENTGRAYETDSNAIDIAFPQGFAEGRGKKKKLLMLIVMMAKAKLALLIPLAAILIKIKAVKALFFAKFALLLSLFGILKKAGSLGALGLGASKLGGLGVGAAALGAGAGAAGGFGGGGYGGGGGGHGGHGGGGGNKIVIIHDPHHATSGGGGGGHSHGHSHGGGGGGGGGGYDSYGPSGGGGGGWSSGGGDSYSGGHDSGGWGRSWTPSQPHNIAYRQHNATASTTSS